MSRFIYTLEKIILCLTVLTTVIVSADTETADADTQWYLKHSGNPATPLEIDDHGEIHAVINFPGTFEIYQEKDRRKLRPNRDEFLKNILSLEVKAVSVDKEPVKAVLFIKDKDGLWFQSRKTYQLESGEWRKLRIDLEQNAHELVPVGHSSRWYSHNAVTAHIIGISLEDSRSRKVMITCRDLKRTGERKQKTLRILDWEIPETGQTYRMFESTFELSREYFNPFDPEEIKIDFEVEAPSGKTSQWPAFFSQDFSRKLRYNHEILTPVGHSYWAFRYTPRTPGKYKFRLIIEDNSGKSRQVVTSPFRTLTITSSDQPGFVRICRTDPDYFELTSGEFFYPIGFNIHAVKDLRCERQLKLGDLPDRGTFSYDDYFSGMHRNGVNAMELWMAAWSTAIEWTSACQNYHGLGRYNLANAWRLDYLLNAAGEKGIYVHLVLDNHGKLAVTYDAEWHDSPYNENTEFAVADGAFLDEPSWYFTDSDAIKYNQKRYRYIAARWGAYTNIFGMELWSEVDLVKGHRGAYDQGTSITWHENAARYLRQLDQGEHLRTTHVCMEYNNILRHKDLWHIDEIDYVVGDAYRSGTPFVDYMVAHGDKVKEEFGKPQMITEFGGTHMATGVSHLEADLHAGLWMSFFTHQAGAPFLWWHEFIHSKGNYHHYYSFSKFMKGIDPRNKNFVTREKILADRDNTQDLINIWKHSNRNRKWLFGWVPGKKHLIKSKFKQFKKNAPRDLFFEERILNQNKIYNQRLGGFTIGNSNQLYGWIYDIAAMKSFPVTTQPTKRYHGQSIVIDRLNPGKYKVNFYNTLSGEIFDSSVIEIKSEPYRLKIPDFRIDTAFKILK